MRILSIAAKDFNTLLKDRKAFIMLLLLPLLLTAILGGALRNMVGSDISMPNMKLGLFIEQADPLAESFEELLTQESFHKIISLETVASQKQLEKKVMNEAIDVGMIIPAEWSENIEKDGLKKVAILTGEKNGFQALFVTTMLKAFIEHAETISASMNAVITDLASHGSLLQETSNDMMEVISQSTEMQESFVKTEPLGKSHVSSMQYYAAAMEAMFLLFVAMIGVKSIMNERLMGTFSRMQSTPTRTLDIIFGKFLGTVYFSLIQFVIFLVTTSFILGVNWGENILQTIATGFAYVIAISGLALLIAAFITNEKTADAISGLGVQVMALLGGSMIPFSLFPELLRKFAFILPNTWALQSFTKVMGGSTWHSLVFPIIFLISIGGFCLCIGSLRLRIVRG